MDALSLTPRPLVSHRKTPAFKDKPTIEIVDQNEFLDYPAVMILDRFPQLLALSESEKLQLAEELYGIALKELPHLSDDEIYQELERSTDEYRREPASASDWQEVRARLLARRHA